MKRNLSTVILFLVSITSFAQKSIPSLNTTVSENFDKLHTSGTVTWNNDSVWIYGWSAWKTGGFGPYTTIQADSGGSNSGKVYSYGSTSSSDRAFGSLASGSSDRVCYGMKLKNNTGGAVYSLEVKYYGEQWRQAGTADNRLAFYYKIDQKIDSLTYNELKFGQGLNAHSDLDFVSPQKSTTAKALNGNDGANRTLLHDTLQITWPAGYEMYILWIDSNDVGSDNALAVDDLEITALGSSDVTPPAVTSATLVGKDSLFVQFSEALDASSASITANYVLSPSATVTSATYDSVTYMVKLSTNMTSGVSYDLIISNIKDLASSPNTMVTDTFGPFVFNPFSTTLKVSSYMVQNLDTVELTFNEEVTRQSAENTGNYIFIPTAAVSSAKYDSVQRKVVLITSLSNGKSHELRISGISDVGNPTRVIKPDTIQGLIFNNYTGGALLMSEISYNDRTAQDVLEFVEVYNSGSSAIELGGLSFSKGVDFVFPEYRLASKGFAIVAKYADTFQQVFGMTALGSFGGGLSNSGEALEIVNGNSEVVDVVTFDDASPWSTQADGGGSSLQLSSLAAHPSDNDQGSNWMVSFDKHYILPGGDTIWASPGTIPASYSAISGVRKEGTDGVNVLNGRKAELRGVVYGVNQRATGLQFSLIDPSGAITVFNTSINFGYSVKEGDSIRVIGTLNQFRGLAQVEALDTVELISSGRPLKDPVVVAVPSESTESDLLKILSFTILNPDANWVSNKNYNATNGTDTVIVRIDGDTEIDGNPIPTGPLNITGLGSQFDASTPLTEGYQILPRYLSDFETITNPKDPEVSFSTTAANTSENGGSISVKVKIIDPNSASTGFKVYVKGGSAMSGLDFNPSFTTDQAFPGSSSQEISLSMQVLNDFTPEGNETIELVIRETTNNASIGVDSVFVLTIADDDVNIENISGLKANNGDGKPARENEKVRVKGIVYGVDLRGGTGLQFTIMDQTGGVAVFSPASEYSYTVKEGDEVTVQGLLGFFNGLTQIGFVDSIVFHQSGQALKSPVSVTVLSEATESELIKLEKFWFVSDTVTVWPSNGSVFVTNGTDIVDVRIDRDVTDLAGSAAPSYDTMNIVGLGSQFDASTPYTEGYQLMPRYVADITEWKNPNSGGVMNQGLKIGVYPNPTSGKIEIVSDLPLVEWKIFDLNGKLMIHSGGQNNNSADLTELKVGVYLMKVETTQGIGVTRVLKQ